MGWNHLFQNAAWRLPAQCWQDLLPAVFNLSFSTLSLELLEVNQWQSLSLGAAFSQAQNTRWVVPEKWGIPSWNRQIEPLNFGKFSKTSSYISYLMHLHSTISLFPCQEPVEVCCCGRFDTGIVWAVSWFCCHCVVKAGLVFQVFLFLTVICVLQQSPGIPTLILLHTTVNEEWLPWIWWTLYLC